MKRLLNVLGALVSDLTQNELAARACRCHKFRSGGFGMELHTYGQALWNAKNATGGSRVRRRLPELDLGPRRDFV